jgi:hypothetical protein
MKRVNSQMENSVVIKTFYGRKFMNFRNKLECCLLASLSRIVQCLRVRQETTQVKHLSGALLQGRLLAFHTNNILGWKGLPRANTLAYYENSKLTAVKVYNIGLWCQCYKNCCCEFFKSFFHKMIIR